MTTQITRIMELHKLCFRSVLANDLCRYVVAVDQYTPGFLDIFLLFIDVGMLYVGHDKNAEQIGIHIH